MKTLTAIAAYSCALLTTVAAAAQGGGDEPSPAPSSGTTSAATAGSVPAPPPMPITACRAGEHAGVDEVDASTAVSLVCAEIARAGAPAGSRYQVTLGRLGSIIILTVTRDGEAPNTIADSREVRLHGIEEVSLAAPRVAEAIVKGTTIKETETVTNLTADDTRTPATKSAKTHFALGIIGNLPPLNRGASPAPGASLELHAEANPFEIVGNFRFAIGGEYDGSIRNSMAAFSVGGRYFTSDTDLAPYLGAGLAWSYFNVEDMGLSAVPGQVGTVANDGLDSYLEAGLEVLRTHHAHLALGMRWDFPFYSLKGPAVTTSYTPSGQTSAPVSYPAPKVYYAPLSFELRLTF